MPLACVINGHFLALHGGISPEIQNCLQINSINRVQEPPLQGGLCDILWSDPVDNATGLQSSIWTFNESRGCSYYFGYHAISDFLKRNELVTLIRAHEAQFDGFKAYVWQNWQFPQVITIFSAPNYCGTYANKGAIIKLNGNEMKLHQYNSTQKPDLVAHLGDAFYWSVPILSKALMDMLVGFIQYTSEEMSIINQDSLNVSKLDQTVFDALDLEIGQSEPHEDQQMSFLEQLVKKQKDKQKVGKRDMVMGGPISNIEILEEQNNDSLNDSVINTPVSDHFEY